MTSSNDPVTPPPAWLAPLLGPSSAAVDMADAAPGRGDRTGASSWITVASGTPQSPGGPLSFDAARALATQTGASLVVCTHAPAIACRRALHSAGLRHVSSFTAGPDLLHAHEIKPAGWAARWPGRALLLVAAATPGAELPLVSLLRRGLDGLGRFERALCSDKDKSLLFFGAPGPGVVVRVPHTRAARAAEERGHRMLDELGRHPGMTTLVPTAVGRVDRDGVFALAETRLRGRPLVEAITRRTRPRYAFAAGALLHELAGVAPAGRGPLGSASAAPLLNEVSGHLAHPAWIAPLATAVMRDLEGADSPLGLVHGDFGVRNLMTLDDARLGLIDWENGRTDAPLILDALNYLDSVERHCRGSTLVETIPLLASGSWPQGDEQALLEAVLARCGLSTRHRRGAAMLYWLWHVAALCRAGPLSGPSRARVDQVASWYLAHGQGAVR